MRSVSALTWVIFLGIFLAAGCTGISPGNTGPLQHVNTSKMVPSHQAWMCDRYEKAGGFTSLPREEVDRVMEPIMRNGTYVGVAIAVIDEGGYDVWGYGETRINSSVVPDENTVFQVASVSKTFTGVLLADSVLRETMSLTAPVARYLPEGQGVPSYDGRDIRLVDLATHTSGLPPVPDAFLEDFYKNLDSGNYSADTYEDLISRYGTFPAEEAYLWLEEVNLTGPVSSTWGYSNVGSAILGDSIARANNSTYRALLEERICGPLGMNSTDTMMTPELAERAATGYRAFRGPLVPAREISFSAFWDPSGGIYSTPRDMVRYTAAAMALCPSSVSEAINISTMPYAVRELKPNTIYQGLQWDIMPLPDGTEVIMKSGETNAFQAQIAFSRQHRKGIIAFSNTANVGEDMHIVTPAVSILMKMLPEESRI